MSAMLGTAVPGSSGSSEQHFSISSSFTRTPPTDNPHGNQMPSPSASDRLTPMPDYMNPVTKSASYRWKKLHEDHMMHKLIDRCNTKKAQNAEIREKALKLARKIPMEVLAKQWLNDNMATIDTRVFLVDKVLPTLILGCEKLLTEVNKRELADCEESDPNFNPINYLARYLLHNNPRYSNFSEASPYMRGMREVGEQLRQQMFDLQDNKLARIKLEAKRRREEREHQEKLKREESDRRHEALETQFTSWNIEQTLEHNLELALIQNALLSFAEFCLQQSSELAETTKYSRELDATDCTGKTIALKEFLEYVEMFIEDMSSEAFDSFISHMNQCSLVYRSHLLKEKRKVQLRELFNMCDYTGVGILDRHRILELFEMFYDKAVPNIKGMLRNPRKWPVIEVQEMSDSMLDADDDVCDEDTTATDSVQLNAETIEPGAEEVKPESAEVPKDDGQVQENVQQLEEEPKPEKDAEAPVTETAVESSELLKVVKEVAPEAATVSSSEETAKQTEEEEEKVEETEQEPEQEQTSEQDLLEDETLVKPLSREGAPSLEDIKEESDQEEPGPPKMEDRGTGGSPVMEVVPVDGREEAKTETETEGVKMVTESQQQLDEDHLVSSAKLPGSASDVPPQTQQSKVSFADGTQFHSDRSMLMSQGNRSVSQGSVFDEDCLNESQFVHINETFLGESTELEVFSQLVRFVQEGYVETEEERMARLVKARAEALSVKRKALLNSLFEMWDNDGSGFLDLDEVVTIMNKYKEGIEQEAVATAKKGIKKKSRHHDLRLSKREFRDFVHEVVDNLAGGKDDFDYFVEFLLNKVERTYTERVRGEARKKWLQQIIISAETSGGSMDPVYKSVFQAPYRDAEAHGEGKVISASIALLEKNRKEPERGDLCLRYTATTPEDAGYMLNKLLHKDMPNISFAVVESGKPIHVPRVANHGRIKFWNTQRSAQDRDGSFIVVPLRDKKKRVFGVMGIDSLNDHQTRAIFITHEIEFFQGVAKAFSIAFHHVDVLQKTMNVSESAISWIQRRCPNVNQVSVYMMEPNAKKKDFVLRKMMYTDEKASVCLCKVPPRLERKDNLFRDYLFKCIDLSESTTAAAYGERHLAFPVRDDTGRAIVVIDVSIAAELKVLPRHETKEMSKMLKILQTAYEKIAVQSRGDVDADSDDGQDVQLLFDKLMLQELRDNVALLDAKAYAELKSYKEPPPVVHLILQAVLAIVYPDKAGDGLFADWKKCKNYLNPTLVQKILAFDPTVPHYDISVELIASYLAEVPHGQVAKAGSIPAQYLYNWVFVCLAMVEHNIKMEKNKPKDDPAPEKEDKAPEEQKQEAAEPPAPVPSSEEVTAAEGQEEGQTEEVQGEEEAQLREEEPALTEQ